MNLEDQNAAPQKRDLLANKHWGSFFSKMPLRDSRAIHVMPDGKTVSSPDSIDALRASLNWTDSGLSVGDGEISSDNRKSATIL
ncbi:MAG: hypothetical protein WCI85_05620 [Comamonadaceae bacterium]